MSSTAFGMQVLTERSELVTPYGQKATAVLLFQDLAIVPLLAVVPMLAPGGAPFGAGGPLGHRRRRSARSPCCFSADAICSTRSSACSR